MAERCCSIPTLCPCQADRGQDNQVCRYCRNQMRTRDRLGTEGCIHRYHCPDRLADRRAKIIRYCCAKSILCQSQGDRDQDGRVCHCRHNRMQRRGRKKISDHILKCQCLSRLADRRSKTLHYCCAKSITLLRWGDRGQDN
jgi:hypothetical protein